MAEKNLFPGWFLLCLRIWLSRSKVASQVCSRGGQCWVNWVLIYFQNMDVSMPPLALHKDEIEDLGYATDDSCKGNIGGLCALKVSLASSGKYIKTWTKRGFWFHRLDFSLHPITNISWLRCIDFHHVQRQQSDPAGEKQTDIRWLKELVNIDDRFSLFSVTLFSASNGEIRAMRQIDDDHVVYCKLCTINHLI